MSVGPRSRRRFLRDLGAMATLGAVATAGCSALPFDGGEPATTIPAGELRAVVEGTPPAIPEMLPVDIEASYLDGASGQVSERLGRVPDPLTATEVPNGAIRQDLAHMRDRAESRLEAAREADTPYEALQSLRRARAGAATLEGAWAAIDDGLTRTALIDRAPEIESARTDFVRRWEYDGDDPVRAAVVYSAIERRVEAARRSATVDETDLEYQPENPITVGELAGELEGARASIDDVAYLYDRYTASVDDPDDLHPALEQGATSLVDDVESRERELPSIDPVEPSELVDRDVEDTPAAEVLEGLYYRLETPDYPAEELAAGRPAHAILVAGSVLARFRALATLRGQIDDGESFEVETAADVRAIRSDAVEAVASARNEIEQSALANQELARLADRLRNVDGQLERHDDAVRTDIVDYEVAEYVTIAAVARALPSTVEQVAVALQ